MMSRRCSSMSGISSAGGILAALASLLGAAAGISLHTSPAAAAPDAGSAPPARTITPLVLSRSPHDTSAFTEGLLLHDGFLFESTGLEGESTLRRVDRATGEVLQSVDLPSDQFGE